MVRRQISLEQLAFLMDHPDQIVEAHGGLVCYQCLSAKNGNPGLLRAIVNEAAIPKNIVIIYRTSKIKKILENMKVTYDPEVDALTIILSDAAVEESDEAKPGVILDYDVEGNIVGLEILNASKRVDNPKAIDYALAS